jgi:hypothetical protein
MQLDALRERIETAYTTSGNSLGWRFLYSPVSVLDHAEVALIGLNPGGTFRPAEHGEFSMPAKRSAYRDESWKERPPGREPLQQQVLALFRHLRVLPQDVLAGNLVPFRAQRFSALVNPDACLRFGQRLWAHVLDHVDPSIVVSMGREANTAVERMLGVRRRRSILVNWGNVEAVRAEFASGGLFIGLPHLSQYKIVNRPESSTALRELFGDHWHEV